MPKFAANLTMLFNEYDFLARFEKAAAIGFTAVEYLFPYQWEAELLAEKLKRHQLIQVLHNLPAGNWDQGERGIACLPGREGEFQEGVAKAIHYAKILGCPRVNCLVGIAPAGEEPARTRERLQKNLLFAADALGREGIRLLVEPLNVIDVPGFSLTGSAGTLAFLAEMGHPNIRLQYDVYHMQLTEGNIINSVIRNLDRIDHIQIADPPRRHEPGTGEINFPNFFAALDAAGYQGWVGCEYKPSGKTEDSFNWLKPYLA